MKLTSYQRHDTADVTIRDPFGHPTDMTVEVWGSDSDHLRKKRVEISRQYPGTDEDSLRERGARLLQACVKSWQNVEGDNGPIEPDSDEALAIFRSGDMDWFSEQIHQASNRRSLFFSKPASD